ncbi:protein of unknown function [Methylomagnum ishizawai]|uniref:Primase C terminal 2 (PriCT-2) n=1 Tax=Methylomagnum ishizawai TaxID=1760988 RepID=A0A1Y6D883_9GAMM|nr:PriCT-2 domain-containing protein [Methylomagnum ishizawai]SMF96983.1 protein of unknown function [Methylomagnum ishizawai]
MKRRIPPTESNIRSALSHVSPSCDRETWVRVLAAIKDALGEDGRAIADEWSQQGDSYGKTDFRDAWKSVKPGGKVAVGTLWRLALDNGWRPDGGERQETEAERLERERKQRARAGQAAEQQAEAARKAAAKASALWKASAPAAFDHPYLERKRVHPVPTVRETTAEQAASILGYPPRSDGEPLAGRVLVVPVKIDGKPTTAELIDEAGRKTAIAGGSKSGGFWAAQSAPKGDGDGLALALGEGVATVLSCREAMKWPVFAALMAGNLPAIVQTLHGRYPKARLVVLGDIGGGLKYAGQAARAVGGILAVPVFTPEQIQAFQDRQGKPPTDWNDLHHLAGLDAVRDQLGKLLAAGPGPGASTAVAGAKPDTGVPFPGTPKQPPKGKPPTPPGGGDDEDEPARPSYVVREDWGRYGPPGVWYHGYRNARKGEPEPLNLWLCSPLRVEAVTCTDDGRYFGRFLRFRDTFGRWREWAMPMEMLRGSCAAPARNYGANCWPLAS